MLTYDTPQQCQWENRLAMMIDVESGVLQASRLNWSHMAEPWLIFTVKETRARICNVDQQ